MPQSSNLSTITSIPLQTVHVIYWEAETGEGLQWFRSANTAELAMEQQIENIYSTGDSLWSVFRFEGKVFDALEDKEVTRAMTTSINQLIDVVTCPEEANGKVQYLDVTFRSLKNSICTVPIIATLGAYASWKQPNIKNLKAA